MLLICMEMNLHTYKSFTWRFYYILYILHSDERTQPVLFDDCNHATMWNTYLRLRGGGRSVRRIPFCCNLGRALTLRETQSSQVVLCRGDGSHVILTVRRAGKFWIIRWSMSFRVLYVSSSMLYLWCKVKLTSEIKEEGTVWSCWCISDSCDWYIS